MCGPQLYGGRSSAIHARNSKGEAFLQNRQLAQGLADQGGHEFLGHGGSDGTLGHEGVVPAVQQGGEEVAASSFGV